VVHLTTGADLRLGGRDILGMAYLGSACSNAGAGVAELRPTAEDDALLAAHEVGHTLGAQHDEGPADGACAAGAFIMSPTAVRTPSSAPRPVGPKRLGLIVAVLHGPACSNRARSGPAAASPK
jgi:hypothetical protein